MSAQSDYWVECVADAAEECGAVLTEPQLQAIAESVENGHETYGMAFYSPPASDRLSVIESEWKAKLATVEAERDRAERNAHAALKKSIGLRDDAHITVEDGGDVFQHGGRTERVL